MASTRGDIAHYFVDEAGDLTLFDKRGTVIVGQEGSSRTFMVGGALIPDPARAHETLEALRRELLADPYFAGVPSMDPRQKKTAFFFHAKDDLPEVRREVFRAIRRLGVKVEVAVRRKAELAVQAQEMFQAERKLKVDAIYDQLVGKISESWSVTSDQMHIVFARRGKATRAEALRNAIIDAREKMAEELEGQMVIKNGPFTIESGYPTQFAGLQIVDYYLWAVQRLFERGEDRFFRALADDYVCISDLDDTRQRADGATYFFGNPGDELILEKLKPFAG